MSSKLERLKAKGLRYRKAKSWTLELEGLRKLWKSFIQTPFVFTLKEIINHVNKINFEL